MESPYAYAVAPRQQRQRQQMPRQSSSSSINNLRTMFQLLSDDEFESEVELERARRRQAAAAGRKNRKKGAPPSSTTQADAVDASRKKTKKNSVSNVTLPVMAAARAAAAMRDSSRSPLQPIAASSRRPETKRQGWDEQYAALLQYKAEHDGSVHVSKKEDSSLYWWIAAQRTAWRKFLKQDDTAAAGALTQNQVARLVEIGLGTHDGGPTNFANNQYSAAFDVKFNELVSFHKGFGHTEVSRDTHKDRFYHLGQWVEMQRSNYSHRVYMEETGGKRKPGKWGTMTDEQYQKLSTLGFRFATNSRPDFDTRFAQLLKYKAAFNDTKVPISYSSTTGGPPNLGQWVAYLKKQHRRKVLDPVRVAQLDSIDFDWKWGLKNDAAADGSSNNQKN